VNKPVKLPEIRKEAFTRARESLGLSAKDLSGMACLSTRQIEQIENGESSSFYGPQVKVTAAKKVAAILKLSEEDAFDFGEMTPGKKGEVKDAVEETEISAAEGNEKVKAIVPEKKIQTQLAKPVMESAKPSLSKQDLNQYASAKNPKKKIFLLLGIAAALVFSIVNLRPLFFPEPVKEEIVVIEEVSPTPPSAEAAAESKPVPAATPEPVAAAPLAVAAASSECPLADATTLNYKPDAPKKAGDMVYLQSKTAQTVCVLDASGKTQNKTLEPGVGASIYGKPPFKVLTSGLSQVDIYYQGAKVRLSNTAAKTINLESAEIVQPLAPTDSQLR
jgi:transcriptional regulator with XRE-family HTH domain